MFLFKPQSVWYYFFINALLFNNRTRKTSDNEEYNGWHLWIFTKSGEIIQRLTG